MTKTYQTIDWHDCFRCDAGTGLLYWRISPSQRVKVGDVAGTINSRGYMHVQFRGEKYLAHRIIWDMLRPGPPLKHSEEIDHIDHDKLNNRISNLRVIPHIENCRNRSVNKNNISGVLGVSFHRQTGKWAVQINVKGRRKHIGLFDSIETAASARKAADIKYNYHENHGRGSS